MHSIIAIFLISKTNSAYMLFYERTAPSVPETQEYTFELSQDMASVSSNCIYLLDINDDHGSSSDNELVVVENLWDKSPHRNIFSFSESVHPQSVPEKKSP